MTKEDKELLLKDICARLPYNVEMHIKGEYKTPRTIFCIHIEDKTVGYFKGLNYNEELIENIKPYLRPMSSMTEAEEDLLSDFNCYYINKELFFSCKHKQEDIYNAIDWLNAHHFDYRGLINIGLALETPKDMYKI